MVILLMNWLYGQNNLDKYPTWALASCEVPGQGTTTAASLPDLLFCVTHRDWPGSLSCDANRF